MNYPRLNFNCQFKDGEILIREVIWPKDSNICQTSIDLLTDPEKELSNILKKIPFPVVAIDAGFDYYRRGKVYHLVKSSNPIARAEYHMIRFWSFWAWWEIRIIKTLAVWGLAEIHPAEIIGWHCVGKRS
ncbi:MAG: hypothetical protein ACRCZS_16235 [Chroococcidiopsis sp.]